MGRAKMGQLKRAAQQLGVTSGVLRQHGWKSAPPARIEAVKDNASDWRAKARENRGKKRARQQMLRDRKTTATRLGIGVCAVKDRGIKPGDVDTLLAAAPQWLVAEQQRRQAQIKREAKDRLRADLGAALVDSVHEVWFEELKYAGTDAEAGATGARWAPEVAKAKKEAQRLAGELTPEQVRTRIGRERASAHTAGVYRATQLVRRASGSDGG